MPVSLPTSVLAATGSAGSDSFVDIDVPFIAWVGLLATIVAMLAVDLVLHRGDKEPTPGRRAGRVDSCGSRSGSRSRSSSAACGGAPRSGEYLAGYLIEKSLSASTTCSCGP